MKQFIILFIAIVFETIGTSALKMSGQFTKLVPSVVSVCAYIVSFYLLSLTLKVIPVGIAYAIWSGVGILLITTIGSVFFKQSLDFASIAGLILIVSGVVVINLFSKSIPH